MAGSYRHVTDRENNFIGIELIDNLGDAYEALEQMYLMIKHLTDNDKAKIHKAWRDGYARKMCPPENEPLFGYDEFWGE